MALQKTISVELLSQKNQNSQGKVELRIWQKKERTSRALKGLGICWAAAVVSIILPIVHFVLVPSLFLAGPIVFFYLFSQTQVIQGGTAICPDCKKEVDLVRSKANWPLTDVCNHCHSHFTIHRMAQ